MCTSDIHPKKNRIYSMSYRYQCVRALLTRVFTPVLAACAMLLTPWPLSAQNGFSDAYGEYQNPANTGSDLSKAEQVSAFDRDFPCVIFHGAETAEEEKPGTSELMEGSTAVAIFIPNNTGANPQHPVEVEWTQQLFDEVAANIEANLQWWTDQAARYGIEKTFHIVMYGPDHPATQVDYDPTKMTTFGVVINDMISALGYSEEEYPPAPDQDRGNLADRQRYFLNDLRDSLETDWAFIGNIIAGAESFRSHAALFGPNTNVWYQAARSGLTFAHEVGHIFGLRDTYRERAPYTYNHEMLGFKNRNADFRNPYTVPCMMKNSWGFSSYTAARLGWIDEPGYTTIHPEPAEAPFFLQYRNPETGQPNAFYSRSYTGMTPLPLGLTQDITLSGFPEAGVGGMMFQDPVWSAPPQWSQDRGHSVDLSVEYIDPVDVEVSYSPVGEPAPVSFRFLYDASPVTAARARAVHAGPDGSLAVAGLDGVVVLQDDEAFVLDAPHGRVDSMFRESRGLAEGPDGMLWFTTHFGEVIGWKGGQYIILPEPQLPPAHVVDADGMKPQIAGLQPQTAGLKSQATRLPDPHRFLTYDDYHDYRARDIGPDGVSGVKKAAADEIQRDPAPGWRGGVFGPLAVDQTGVVWTAEDPQGSASRTGGSGLHRFERFGSPEHTIFSTRNSPILSDNVSSLDLDGDGYLWIGFDGGRGGDFDQGLQRFHPENETWEDLSGELPNTRVQLIRYAGERIIVGYTGGFSEYRDGEWEHWVTGLAGVVRDADVDDHGNVFLATVSGLGVYRNGEEQMLFNESNTAMPENHVSAVRVIEPGKLLLGFWLYGGAILEYDASLITSGEVADLPRDVLLHQNYPNPFNPSTVIRFELPAEMAVRLEVFDVLGRRVATLLNERLDSGMYDVAFDASGVASGVYLYRLQTDMGPISRKMILVR